MKKLIRLLLIIIVFSIILLEIALRKFYYEELKTRITSTNRIPDSLVVFDRRPNFDEIYYTPGVNNKFRSNNQGYIGPDFNSKKDTGVFRIIVVGNSNAVGMQMNSTNNFCVYLQKNFNSYQMPVEVINCSREGGEKDIQNLYLIKNRIIYYQPDIILLENTGNRLQFKRYVYEGYRNYTLEYDPSKPKTRNECVRLVDNLYKYSFLTMFFDMSYIIRMFCKHYVDKHSNWDVQKLFLRNNKFEIYLYTYIKKDAKVNIPVYYVSWNYATKELNSIISKLQKINCKLVLFTYSSYDNEMKNFFKKLGINFIELNMEDFDNLPLNSKLEGHLNETGHALMAERFQNQLYINKCIHLSK